MKKLLLLLALVSMFSLTACFHAEEVVDEADDTATDVVEPVDEPEAPAADTEAADDSASGI